MPGRLRSPHPATAACALGALVLIAASCVDGSSSGPTEPPVTVAATPDTPLAQVGHALKKAKDKLKAEFPRTAFKIEGQQITFSYDTDHRTKARKIKKRIEEVLTEERNAEIKEKLLVAMQAAGFQPDQVVRSGHRLIIEGSKR